MRQPMVAGNWKMHCGKAQARQLLSAIAVGACIIDSVELAVFPPFVYLSDCTELLANTSVRWGAQTVSEYNNGAYTGEVSVAMLKEFSCHYVIVGHSERRRLFGETHQQIAQKFKMALESDVFPILCVGETLEQRKRGETLSVVQEQLAVACCLKDNCSAFAQVVIAYEPVWAIGTGETATPEQAQEVHAAIRAWLASLDTTLAHATRILYGGSVNPDNAKALFAMPDIDGALVGGASLNAEYFLAIGKQCNN